MLLNVLLGIFGLFLVILFCVVFLFGLIWFGWMNVGFCIVWVCWVSFVGMIKLGGVFVVV